MKWMRWLWWGFLGLLLVGLIAIALYREDFQTSLTGLLEWVKTLGPLGPLTLGLFYVVATIFALPAAILTLGAGFAFGVIVGFITVSLASITGASLSFLISRKLARGLLLKRFANSSRFKALDEGVREHGFKIVLMTRLSPLFPFNFLNYAYGLTDIRFRDYFFASWLGMIPGTILYVYLGSAVQNIATITAEEMEGGVGELVVFGIGLLATLVVTVVITRIARKSLAKAVPFNEISQDEERKTLGTDSPTTSTDK
ncbi:Integral membrane protein, DedA family [Planctomycetales bacterium 10988]|nr:Integral membrane protein, DedA family [Planctomycetales bacterium 10988]